MKLVGRKEFVINRFGKAFRSNEDGVIVANTDEEVALFKAYGFVAVHVEPVVETPTEKVTEEVKEVLPVKPIVNV